MSFKRSLAFLLIFVSCALVHDAFGDRGGSRRGRVHGVTTGEATLPAGFSEVVIFAANSADFD